MSKQKPWSEIVRKTADDRIARMTDCEESLVNRIRELERQLADRDIMWEEAVRLNYDQTFGLNVDGFIIVVRRWIENKEGKT